MAESVLARFPLGNSHGEGSGWQLSAGKLTRCDFKINGEIVLCPWKSLGLINGWMLEWKYDLVFEMKSFTLALFVSQ